MPAAFADIGPVDVNGPYDFDDGMVEIVRSFPLTAFDTIIRIFVGDAKNAPT